MVKYLLDTCIIISALRGKDGIQQQICAVGIQNCAISELTMAELYIGPLRQLESLKDDDREFTAEAKHCSAQLESLELIPSKIAVLPWGGCSFTFAKIHEQLRHAGLQIEDFDLMIGAQAVAGDFVLVTGNEKHFDRIPGLTIQNWYKH